VDFGAVIFRDPPIQPATRFQPLSMNSLRFLLLLIIVPPCAFAATPAERGKFEKLAAQGDAAAMVELGLLHHTGKGGSVDYVKAMDWYLKAYAKSDGDAFNNIGVLFRDGLGVPKNQKVAYLLFLIVHMEGLGDDATQNRAGRNLSRLVESLPRQEVEEALSYTLPYLSQIVQSRGKDLTIGKDVLPAKDRLRFRDADWWLDSEKKKMTFDSPAPWNQKGG
jgi:TPR repeat protein